MNEYEIRAETTYRGWRVDVIDSGGMVVLAIDHAPSLQSGLQMATAATVRDARVKRSGHDWSAAVSSHDPH